MILFMPNKGISFVTAHIITALLFAIIYYLEDRFILNYPTLAKKVGFGSIKNAETMEYYIYYSLITQSTVGYAGGKGGGTWQQVRSNAFKITNIVQLISIFVITGYNF